MARLQYVLNRLPQFYNKDNTSRIYNILSSISSELGIFDTNIINRLDAMISIDTTYGQDLDIRWGALLNIKRILNESDNDYKLRLKTSIIRLNGGTSRSIQYAIAIVLRINNDQPAMDNRIKIYDSWEYPDIDLNYFTDSTCSIICNIDFNNSTEWDTLFDMIINMVDIVKAAGILAQFSIHNIHLLDYQQLTRLKYYQLYNIEYNNLI